MHMSTTKEMIMSANVLKNGLDLATGKSESQNVLVSFTKSLRDMSEALHKARAMSDLVTKGVNIEKAYDTVYKQAA